ncbi:MAG: DUF1080 domain-containing protein [Phycisphaerae bacterium]|nr:DUF1080 domain-containing protein [Phycisphaerae bacterium]
MVTTALAVVPLLAALLVAPSDPPAAPSVKPSAAEEAKEASPDAGRLGDPVKLFDGTSLAGWKPFLSGGDPAKVWSVRDGVVVCTGNPVGYIATEKEYESFELTLEWRFDASKGDGNSGVLMRVQGPDKVGNEFTWPRSVEAQLQSKSAGDIWNIGDVPMKVNTERTKGRHTAKAHPTNEKPLGEWNRYRIVLNGGTLELYVNDLLQNTATDVEVKPGRIALQSEGAHIEFRNIVLRPFNAPLPATGR